MSRMRWRRTVDAALAATFVGAWLTHEAGVLVHSLASLLFTLTAMLHANQNWKTYTRGWKHFQDVSPLADNALVTLLVAVTFNGFTLWIWGPQWALGHGIAAVAATLFIASHLVIHRRSLRRLVARRPTRQTATQ
jgi:hypothetical protein